MKNLDSEALEKAAAKLFAASETKPIANWKRLTERAKDYWRKLASIVADALSTKPNKGEAEPKRSDADAVRDIMAHADDDLTEYGKSQLLLPDKPNEGEGVKVKPLEWKHYDETNVSSEEWIAHGVLGFNTVVSKGGNVWRYGTRLYSTIEEAKAAAQADYAARIRSALVSPPESEPVAVEGHHKWVPSTLGHGETMCEYCKGTNRELAVLGELNRCSKAPPSQEANEAEVERIAQLTRSHTFSALTIDEHRDLIRAALNAAREARK